MLKHFKLRRQDTFRTGKENGFRRLFRNWLSADGFGICRSRRPKKPQDNAPEYKQATESVKDVPHLKSDSIAANKPGNVDLYLLLKKRSAQSLSDRLESADSGRNRPETDERKAVQE